MEYLEIVQISPRFSIIMPLYNKEAYVEKSIRNILSQSFLDWELVIVDDGSTDGSYDVAERVIEGDNRCRIINQANAGVGAARNRGVVESRGKYLCFLDADDWWESTFLEEMTKFVEQYPDAGLYASNYYYYKPGKTHIAVDSSTEYINYPRLYFENGEMPVWTGAVCIPRDVFEKSGGFPTGIKIGEDFLLWSKIATESQVAFLNKPLAYYNNEIAPSQRATRHLYAPELHMLFNMDWLEKKVSMLEVKDDWKNLLDMLRVKGLLEYWISSKYHHDAMRELAKVDWDKQPESVIRMYKFPRWWMAAKMRILYAGVSIKGMFLKDKCVK